MRLSLLLLCVCCGLSPIELEGKRCPCREGSGFVCDDATMTCVLALECDALARATSFRAAWATSNVIAWAWEPEGLAEDFVGYELRVWDPREPENVRVIDPSENPELGGYFLPRTEVPDPVNATLSYDHASETTFAARLVVLDRNLCEFRSDVVAVSTLADPAAEVVLVGDEPPPAITPPAFSSVDDGAGGRVLEYRSEEDDECGPEETELCSQNLTARRLDADLSRLTEADFTSTAFVELDVAYDGRAPVYYTNVQLSFNADCAPDPPQFRYTPFTLGPPGRVIQIPLRVFLEVDSGVALDDETARLIPLCRASLGGRFARFTDAGSPMRVRIAEIRVRY